MGPALMKVATLTLRVLQIIVAAFLLIVAVILIHGHGPGHSASIVKFGGWCGIVGIVFAIVGLVMGFVDKLQGLFMVVVDFLVSTFVIAGAAAYTNKVKSGSCVNVKYVTSILPIIGFSDEKTFAGNNAKEQLNNMAQQLVSRCYMVQVEASMLWVLVLCFVASIFLSFLGRSGKLGGAVV